MMRGPPTSTPFPTATPFPSNDAPVAVDDPRPTDEDPPLVVPATGPDSLQSNDTDIDNTQAQLSVTAVSNPTHGTVSRDATTGVITFSPDANYNGVAGFDYTLSDGALTDTGHVTVN